MCMYFGSNIFNHIYYQSKAVDSACGYKELQIDLILCATDILKFVCWIVRHYVNALWLKAWTHRCTCIVNPTATPCLASHSYIHFFWSCWSHCCSWLYPPSFNFHCGGHILVPVKFINGRKYGHQQAPPICIHEHIDLVHAPMGTGLHLCLRLFPLGIHYHRLAVAKTFTLQSFHSHCILTTSSGCAISHHWGMEDWKRYYCMYAAFREYTDNLCITLVFEVYNLSDRPLACANVHVCCNQKMTESMHKFSIWGT